MRALGTYDLRKHQPGLLRTKPAGAAGTLAKPSIMRIPPKERILVGLGEELTYDDPGDIKHPDGGYIVFDPTGYVTQTPGTHTNLSGALYEPETPVTATNAIPVYHDTVSMDQITKGHIVHLSPAKMRAAIARRLPGNDGAKPPAQMSLRARLQYAMKQSWNQLDMGPSLWPGFLHAMPNGMVMDRFDAGNFLWGASMQQLRIPRWLALLGAHYNAVIMHGQFDSRADQMAISMGYSWASE